MRVYRVKTRLIPVGSKQEIIVKNDIVIGDNERVKNVLERLYTPENFKIVTFDFYELCAYMGKHVFDIGKINYADLAKQKGILINMIQDWGEADDSDQRKDALEAEGLLSLINRLQDYAVDVLGEAQAEVFPNLEKEAEELGEMLDPAIGMDEDEFRKWVIFNQPIEDGNTFYDNAPPKVKKILNSFDEDGSLYEECVRVVEKLNQVGYTAEFGLDGQSIFDFRAI